MLCWRSKRTLRWQRASGHPKNPHWVRKAYLVILPGIQRMLPSTIDGTYQSQDAQRKDRLLLVRDKSAWAISLHKEAVHVQRQRGLSTAAWLRRYSHYFYRFWLLGFRSYTFWISGISESEWNSNSQRKRLAPYRKKETSLSTQIHLCICHAWWVNFKRCGNW